MYSLEPLTILVAAISLWNGSLLALGALFVAIPVVLHLTMRPKPKRLVFPAIRFLQQRQMINRRRMRLRQWMLLALRVLVILLLATALARPTVSSQTWATALIVLGLILLLALTMVITAWAFAMRQPRALLAMLMLLDLMLLGSTAYAVPGLWRGGTTVPIADRAAPVAAVIVVDNSPRMSLLYANETRLQQAQRLADWLIGQLPPGSQIAVLDRGNSPATFAVDRGAARTLVDAFEITYLPASWADRLDQALDLLERSDLDRHELYLISDLTEPTWTSLRGRTWKEPLRQQGVTVQVIDVGQTEVTNSGLVELKLSAEHLANGSPLKLGARIARRGTDATTAARLWIEPPSQTGPIVIDGRLDVAPASLRGERQIVLPSEGDASCQFVVGQLPIGTHHGWVEIEAQDGYPLDDRRYFTLTVRPPWPILVLATNPREAQLLAEQLAPLEFRRNGRARFDCTQASIDQLDGTDLSGYAAVALIDPPPLSDKSWSKLQRYQASGGGIAIFLGPSAGSVSRFNSAAALAFLPGPLARQWRSPDGVFFAPRHYDHFILQPFSEIRDSVPWQAMPVFRHWVMEPLTEQARIVLPYDNGLGAIVENSMTDAGRSLVVTTPLQAARLQNDVAWNELATSLESWPVLVLLDRMFLYLVGSDQSALNYTVGQTVRLSAHGGEMERIAMLDPLLQWRDVVLRKGMLEIGLVSVPGIYRLKIPRRLELPRGFAVNTQGSASLFDRIDKAELEAAFGSDQFTLARNREQIIRKLDETRAGREFYPLLLLLLVLVLALEYLLSNRFYPSSLPPATLAASPAA